MKKKAKKRYRVLLNPILAQRQGLSRKEIQNLQQLHETRLDIEEAMSKTDDRVELRKLFQDWTLCQFELQKGWGFSEDTKFHQFWTVPKCECPRMDNEDNYPTGHYIYNLSCPVHSEEIKLSVPVPFNVLGVLDPVELFDAPPEIPKRKLNLRNELEAIITVVVLAALATLLIKWYVS